jgi:hypothetical protein
VTSRSVDPERVHEVFGWLLLVCGAGVIGVEALHAHSAAHDEGDGALFGFAVVAVAIGLLGAAALGGVGALVAWCWTVVQLVRAERGSLPREAAIAAAVAGPPSILLGLLLLASQTALLGAGAAVGVWSPSLAVVVTTASVGSLCGLMWRLARRARGSVEG